MAGTADVPATPITSGKSNARKAREWRIVDGVVQCAGRAEVQPATLGGAVCSKRSPPTTGARCAALLNFLCYNSFTPFFKASTKIMSEEPFLYYKARHFFRVEKLYCTIMSWSNRKVGIPLSCLGICHGSPRPSVYPQKRYLNNITTASKRYNGLSFILLNSLSINRYIGEPIIVLRILKHLSQRYYQILKIRFVKLVHLGILLESGIAKLSF